MAATKGLAEQGLRTEVFSRAIHIAESKADNLSRVYQTNFKWTIQDRYIRAIFNTWRYPQVDLFASAEPQTAP